MILSPIRPLVVVIGRRGSGKSTFLRGLADREARRGLVISADPLIYTPDPEALADDLPDSGLVGFDDAETAALIALYARDCWLTVDEADFKTGEYVLEVARRGRHYNIAAAFGVQRPAEIPRTVTSNATHFVLLATHEPRDLDYLYQLAGDEVADAVAALPHGRLVIWRPGAKFDPDQKLSLTSPRAYAMLRVDDLKNPCPKSEQSGDCAKDGQISSEADHEREGDALDGVDRGGRPLGGELEHPRPAGHDLPEGNPPQPVE